MQAIEITEPGGPEVLKLCSRDIPTPNSDQVIIQVAYAGVNRPDALQRAGLYNPPAGAISFRIDTSCCCNNCLMEIGKDPWLLLTSA